jgi:hypothetical protein
MKNVQAPGETSILRVRQIMDVLSVFLEDLYPSWMQIPDPDQLTPLNANPIHVWINNIYIISYQYLLRIFLFFISMIINVNFFLV